MKAGAGRCGDMRPAEGRSENTGIFEGCRLQHLPSKQETRRVKETPTMGTWIDANPEAFLTIVLAVVGVVVYIVRMEGKVGKIEARVTACEQRAQEDRGQIKERLDSIESTVSATKSAVDQIVGALHGRRRVTDLSPDSLERL